MGTLFFFILGYAIGMVLFLICVRKGMIQKWSGFDNKQKPTSMGLRHI